MKQFKYVAAGFVLAALCPTVSAQAASTPCAVPARALTAAAEHSAVQRVAPDARGRLYHRLADGSALVSECVGAQWQDTKHLIDLGTSPGRPRWAVDATVAPDQALAGGLVITSGALERDPSDHRIERVPAGLDPVGGPATGLLDQSSETPAGGGTVSTNGDPCSQTGYRTNAAGWPGGSEGYRTRDSSFPYTSFRSAAIAGLNAWRDTYTNCGFGDTSLPVPSLLGSTTLTYHTYSDNTSVVDYGSINNTGCAPPAGYVVVGCTASFVDSSGRIHEFDTRYTDAPSTLATSGQTDRVDFQSLATHESGHAIGLGHVGSTANNAQTMFNVINRGDVGGKTLGKGDILGMRALYS